MTSIAASCAASDRAPLLSDLSLRLACHYSTQAEFEKVSEQTLRAAGFKVGNVAPLERALGNEGAPLHLVGVDSEGRFVIVTSFQGTPGKIFVDLYTKPPTKHMKSVETAVAQLGSRSTGCEIEFQSSRENAGDAIALYEDYLKIVDAQLRGALGAGGLR
jgi:hypothetical protein